MPGPVPNFDYRRSDEGEPRTANTDALRPQKDKRVHAKESRLEGPHGSRYPVTFEK